MLIFGMHLVLYRKGEKAKVFTFQQVKESITTLTFVLNRLFEPTQYTQ
uniref:Uncharacterized protein n=1 Tax=Anguilla anguilla TaxID=7936 RepID=A0A0E9WP07_ANGAN